MNELESEATELAPEDPEILDEANALPGVITVLGELGPGALITEEGMSNLFHRHPTSVKRAVARGELPPPCRLFGANAWTARSVIDHIEDRLAEAAKEVDEIKQTLGRHSP